MDNIWRFAPFPALRLWSGHQGDRFEANDAAQLWGQRHGILPADWSSLGRELQASPDRKTEPQAWMLAPLAHSATGDRIDLPDGALWWLRLDETPLSRLMPAAEQVALMQDAGRMGLAVRDLQTQEGVWDPHMYDIMGLPQAQGTPDFQSALVHVHPDDRQALQDVHDQRREQPGRYNQRFRIVRPDGEVRHLNSLYEIRPFPDRPGHVLVSLLIDDTEIVERERIQNEATRLLERAVSLAGIIVWKIDLQANTIRFNEVGEQYFKGRLPAAEMSLEAMRAEVHPDDLPRVKQALDEALASERVVDVMARYRDGQNQWRQLLTRRVAQRDAQGRAVGVLGVSLDITEQVAERERSMSLLERMQLAAEAIGVGFWSRDLDAAVTDWDERMYRLHHRDPSLGPPSLDEWLARHVHASDRAMMAARQAEQDAHWTPASDVLFRIPSPQGGERWIQSWTRRIVRNGHRVAFGIHVDVTEQRLAQLTAERERERDRFAIEAAGIGLWERSLGERPSYWSPAMYRLRGLDPDDPRPLQDLVKLTAHPEDVAQANVRMAQCLSAGQPYRHDFAVRWPDGSEHWISSVGRPVRDAEGRAVAIAGVNVDITERRLAEQMARERDRAAEAHAAQSELMARVSHELRTPMNAVLGFADLMAADDTDPLPAAQRERLMHIRTAGGHLLALIDDLLDISRADAGRRSQRLLPVALNDVLQDAVAWVRGLAREHGVQVHAPPLTGLVMAHRRWLGQVLTNLLTNGVKYNRPGGAVRVAVEAAELRGAPAWALIVSDDGRGLTPAQQARLFEPFNRLGMEREGIAGTGIGLSIVQRLVRDMEGEVSVHSQPGLGSSFRVCLPAAGTPLPGDAEAPSPLDAAAALPPDEARANGSSAGSASGEVSEEKPAAVPPARLRVLYVEDNPVNEMLLGEMLSLRPRAELWTAPDGRSGLAQARLVRPQVLLLDLQLPDMSGTEVMQALRMDPLFQGCSFIALSANAMPQDIEAALQAGFDDYWTKPLVLPQFLSAMQALEQQHLASESLSG